MVLDSLLDARSEELEMLDEVLSRLEDGDWVELMVEEKSDVELGIATVELVLSSVDD